MVASMKSRFDATEKFSLSISHVIEVPMQCKLKHSSIFLIYNIFCPLLITEEEKLNEICLSQDFQLKSGITSLFDEKCYFSMTFCTTFPTSKRAEYGLDHVFVQRIWYYLIDKESYFKAPSRDLYVSFRTKLMENMYPTGQAVFSIPAEVGCRGKNYKFKI